ncbi:Uncharacterised protein [Klebsiella pneumoniae]|nr:Uncharacterised protein [Klebsiella pneumoniae]
MFTEHLQRHCFAFAHTPEFSTKYQCLIHGNGPGLPLAPLDVLGQH